jgi:hypothetical protein
MKKRLIQPPGRLFLIRACHTRGYSGELCLRPGVAAPVPGAAEKAADPATPADVVRSPSEACKLGQDFRERKTEFMSNVSM